MFWMLRILLATLLLALGAWFAERAARSLGLPGRWVWITSLLAAAVLPLLWWLLPHAWEAPARLAGSVGIALLEPADSPPIPYWRSGAASYLWLCSSAVALFLFSRGHRRLARARRGWRAERVAGRVVLVSSNLGPAVVGLIRPVIVLPAWLVAASERVRRVVVLHEAEHLRAGDALLLGLAPLVLVAMPWNLPLWWMLRELRLAVELDCDGRVLRRGVDARVYGRALIDVAEQGVVHPFAVALSATRPKLRRRLEHLTSSARPWKLVPCSLAAGLLWLLTLGASPASRTAADLPLDGLAFPWPFPELLNADSRTRFYIDDAAATAKDVQSLERSDVAQLDIRSEEISQGGEPLVSSQVVRVYTRGSGLRPDPLQDIDVPALPGNRTMIVRKRHILGSDEVERIVHSPGPGGGT